MGSATSAPFAVARSTANSLYVRPTWHSMLVSGGGPPGTHPAGLPHASVRGSRSRILGVVLQIRRKAPC